MTRNVAVTFIRVLALLLGLAAGAALYGSSSSIIASAAGNQPVMLFIGVVCLLIALYVVITCIRTVMHVNASTLRHFLAVLALCVLSSVAGAVNHFLPREHSWLGSLAALVFVAIVGFVLYKVVVAAMKGKGST